MAYRISLIGATYSGNKGAAGMLSATISCLGRMLPDESKFFVFSLYPRRDEPLKQEDVRIVPCRVYSLVFLLCPISVLYFLFSWFPPFRRLLLSYYPLSVLVESNVLLDLSGISFVDDRTATLVYNAACLLPALFLKTPIVKLSQALGPFKKFLNRLVAGVLLKKVTRIFSRGESTSANLSDLGLSNWEPAADLAFLLDDVTASRYKEILTIGVSPSQVMLSYCEKNHIDYKGEMADYLSEIVKDRHAEILIIAHSNLGPDVSSRNNDYQVCTELAALLPEGHVDIHLEDSSPGKLREFIAGCDVFVASRFHSMISALCTSTPVLVTAWSHKYLEVMNIFGCGEWVIGLRDISKDKLCRKTEVLLDRRKDVSRLISEALPQVRKSAYSQLEWLACFLHQESGNEIDEKEEYHPKPL